MCNPNAENPTDDEVAAEQGWDAPAAPQAPTAVCPKCFGHREVSVKDMTTPHFNRIIPCPQCSGTGRIAVPSPAQAPTLLPCPFCGGTDLDTVNFNGQWWCQCDSPSCYYRSKVCDSKDEAIAAWNAGCAPSPQAPATTYQWTGNLDTGRPEEPGTIPVPPATAPAPSATRVLIECEPATTSKHPSGSIVIGRIISVSDPQTTGWMTLQVVRISVREATAPPSGGISSMIVDLPVVGVDTPGTTNITMPVRVVLYADAQKLEQELATARQENERLQGEIARWREAGKLHLTVAEALSDTSGELIEIQQRYERLVAGLRELHRPGKPPEAIWCHSCGTSYPCQTVRLLPPITSEVNSE